MSFDDDDLLSHSGQQAGIGDGVGLRAAGVQGVQGGSGRSERRTCAASAKGRKADPLDAIELPVHLGRPRERVANRGSHAAAIAS